MVDVERGFTDELWAKMADLGWLGLLVPEAHGGLGLGLVDLAVVQEEMGKALFPGPYLSSAVMATSAALALGATDLLPALAAGERRGTLALEELSQGDPLGGLTTTAVRSGDGWVLDGLKPVVLDGHTADWAIVVAQAEGGLGAFLTEQDIQIHGGMGFTWDVDAHLFYRRVKQNDLLLGHQAWHRQRLADLVLASG